MRESRTATEHAAPIPMAREPVAARREAPVVRGRECQLGVRYYRRMRLQRIYNLVVEGPREGAGYAGLLSIHPLIPGASVMPAEQELDATRPGARAEFAVTPLAGGRLRAAQIEVRSHGRLVQTIPLAMRATTQRLTWLLLALTLLVPPLIRYATIWHPLSGVKYLDSQKFKPAADLGAARNAAMPEQRAPAREQGKNEEQQADDDAKKDADKQNEPAKDGPRPGDPPPRGGNPGRARGEGGGARLPGPPPLPRPPDKILEPAVPVAMSPGEVLEKEINEIVPDLPRALLPEDRREGWMAKIGDFSLTKWTGAQLNDGYQLAIVMEKDNRLSFYVGLTLLTLTLISWIVHSSRRAYRRGQPLLAPAVDLSRGADSPATPRRSEPPIALNPIE